jgi:hypothetical protein
MKYANKMKPLTSRPEVKWTTKDKSTGRWLLNGSYLWSRLNPTTVSACSTCTSFLSELQRNQWTTQCRTTLSKPNVVRSRAKGQSARTWAWIWRWWGRNCIGCHPWTGSAATSPDSADHTAGCCYAWPFAASSFAQTVEPMTVSAGRARSRQRQVAAAWATLLASGRPWGRAMEVTVLAMESNGEGWRLERNLAHFSGSARCHGKITWLDRIFDSFVVVYCMKEALRYTARAMQYYYDIQLCGLWSHDFAAPLSVFLGSWDVWTQDVRRGWAHKNGNALVSRCRSSPVLTKYTPGLRGHACGQASGVAKWRSFRRKALCRPCPVSDKRAADERDRAGCCEPVCDGEVTRDPGQGIHDRSRLWCGGLKKPADREVDSG